MKKIETEKKIDSQIRAFFEGFSDKHRMKILELLLERRMNVTEICSHFTMKQPSVSHHLAVLKKSGVIETQREGKEIYYSINRKNIASLMTYYLARYGLEVKEI